MEQSGLNDKISGMEIYNPNKQSEVLRARREINGQIDRLASFAVYTAWKASPYILGGRLLGYLDQNRPLLHNLAAVGSGLLAWGMIGVVNVISEIEARDHGFDVDVCWDNRQRVVIGFVKSTIGRLIFPNAR